MTKRYKRLKPKSARRLTSEEIKRQAMIREKSARDETRLRDLGLFTSMGSHILSDLKGKVHVAYTPSNMIRNRGY